MIDIAKIEPPPVPDFGDDEVGRIAAFMHEHRRAASFSKFSTQLVRDSNQRIGNARKKTQRAWASMIKKLGDDVNLVSILDKRGLLEPLNEISKIVAAGYDPHPDDGTPPHEPHTLLALWAANEFFPDIDNLSEAARTLNAALQRAGYGDADRTNSIRVALMQDRREQNSERRAAALNWKPPKV